MWFNDIEIVSIIDLFITSITHTHKYINSITSVVIIWCLLTSSGWLNSVSLKRNIENGKLFALSISKKKVEENSSFFSFLSLNSYCLLFWDILLNDLSESTWSISLQKILQENTTIAMTSLYLEYPCQNCSKLLPRNTVDDEVDGAVEHGQVASYHVHQHLPFWHEICPIRRVEALNDETISDTEKMVIFSLPGISPRQIIYAPYKVRQNKWKWS